MIETAPDRDSVGVIGAGTMGAGIAQSCATAGLSVALVDVSAAQLARGEKVIAGSLAKLAAKGALPRPAAEIERKIRRSSELADVARAEVVIEAVFEDLGTKREVFAKLDGICRKDAILASNTSSISISTLAEATTRPEKVVGIHFMNPVPLMSLVEVVSGQRTSDDTLARATEFVHRLGKTPVQAKDAPGFIANRVLMPMINEAIQALGEGIGSAEDIDRVMTLGMNHPMGPLALADLIGLDVCLAIMQVLHHDLASDKYAPAPLLQQYVKEGRLGRKSGRGFYTYG